MIVLIVLLLTAVTVSQNVSCLSVGSVDTTELNDSVRIEKERDYNSILDELPGRSTRPSSLRSRRNTLESTSSNTGASIRVDYERAINQTVSDYYAQRKAVMDRYYARQREIVEKFARKNSKSRGETDEDTRLPLSGNFTKTERYAGIEKRNVTNWEDNEKLDEGRLVGILGKHKRNQVENTNPSVANSTEQSAWWQPDTWTYRPTNWNPRKQLVDATVIDPQSGSSINLENSNNRTVESNNAGYYKLGEFKGSTDEKLVYQHNLGVGLKGSSQLDANFEVVIEGSYAITVVEAFPYANTRANLSWVSGGPGSDKVKLKLRGYENEGFSYTVKVWGVPK